MFTKNNNIKVKRETDAKINLHARYIGCGCKTLAAMIQNF